jgi:hypothetical protein
MNYLTSNQHFAYATLLQGDRANQAHPGSTSLNLYRMGIYLLAFLLVFTLKGISAPVVTAAALPETPSKEVIANMTKDQKEARFMAMKERVAAIKAMDRSTMTKEERKALRMELRHMNKEARSMGYTNGIYISVGALIIIILLLILIL